MLRWTEGSCESVSDQEIAAAKKALGQDGVGCEPASAATAAGLRRLRQSGRIEADADVVVLLTGHQLKDTQFILEERNSSVHKFRLEPDLNTAAARLSSWLESGS